MCGLIGVISQSEVRKDAPFLQKACDAIRHRGPDDQGLEVFDRAIVGFRRLSIIDLSANGHQPMPDVSGRYRITFNGEIYNFQDLRDDLIRKGYEFKSRTDTETILNGYIEYGAGIVARLEGMFSFIIYDSHAHEFFAARDRLGKKPLLIWKRNDSYFLFSELKQILEIPGFNKAVNFRAIRNYFSYGAVSNPDTIYDNVSTLPPASYLTIKNGQLEIKRYWHVEQSTDRLTSYEDARANVRELTEKAVRKRLISDVPLGAFLSGGVDSTIIVGLMRKFSNSTLKTFSIQYKDANETFDESYYAELVAKKFETEHAAILIDADGVANELDKIIWHIDQPSCDAINTYFVSMSARRGVTVALSGVGADELFAGYSTFKFADAVNRWKKSTGESGSWSEAVTRLFYKLPLNVSSSWKLRGGFSLLGAFPTIADRYKLIKNIYYPGDLDSLLSHDQFAHHRSKDPVDLFFQGNGSDIQKISAAEINHYLVNTLLRDSDVMGMAHSLEIRAPFVDHHLVEFASTLPDVYKIRKGTSKVIFKDAFSDILPPQVVHRKKMGFAFPLAIWLKSGKLREIMEDCLSHETVKRRGWLNPAEVELHKRRFLKQSSATPNSYQLYQRVWTILVLELWARKFVD